jgi:cytochrome c
MKDPLFGNKLAAAALVIALLYFGLPILVNIFVGGGSHHGGDYHGEVDPENPLHLAYPVEIKLEGAPVVDEPEIDLGTLLAAASVDRGARAVGACKSCHTFEQGGANGTGPNLWDIVGHPVAAIEGFGYTTALQEFGGTWTYERLDKYLENSKAYIPGTEMAQRVRKEGKRADILAYLQSLSDNPVPFPEPAPVIEEVAEAGAEILDAAAEAAGDVVEEVVETVGEVTQ